MKTKNIFFSGLLAIALLGYTSCDSDDNAPGVKPDPSTIASLQEAPYPVGAAVSINSLKNNERYRQTVIKEMSSLTGENAMKMNTISKGRKQYFWDDADYLVNFAQDNGKRVHGHTLIWYKHTPSWVSNFSGSQEEWKTILKEYIQDVVGRYKGKVSSWDVVNEIATDEGKLRDCIWLQKIGPEYIELSFQYAHEADPDAILFYNDYGHEYSAKRRNFVRHLVDSFVVKKVPLHGIGIQMHTNINRSTADLRYAVTSAAVAKVKVHVSELDVAVNPDKKDITFTEELAEKQRRVYYDVAKVMADIPEEYQYGITMWGVNDPGSWLSPNPDWALLFNDQYEKKAAYEGFVEGFLR